MADDWQVDRTAKWKGFPSNLDGWRGNPLLIFQVLTWGNKRRGFAVREVELR